MEGIKENAKIFINTFSNSEIATTNLPSKIELPIHNKFLTNDIGIKYIGNMIKDIDVRLYLAYLQLLKDKIHFVEDFNAENSICINEVILGVTQNVQINVPCITNGLDILVTAHELGHGLKSITKLNNDRYLHSTTIYDETISILFGKLCLDRYINDFGYDIFAQQFDLLNISNAINCLEKLKTLLPKYIEKEKELAQTNPKIVKNPRHDDNKYHSLVAEVENLQRKVYILISYPIGISLANVYDNFDKKQKEEYLEFVSKYLLNIKHIDFEMILEYFTIPFDASFYIQNFKEYIQKFASEKSKKLVLGGKK